MIASPGPDAPEAEQHAIDCLHRSATDRVCRGVCAGIAEDLVVDPSLVRLAFVIATLWGGIGLMLYIVLAIILPVDDHATTAATRISAERSHVLAGLMLVVLGGFLLASNVAWAPWLSWNLFWPCVLMLAGLELLARQTQRTEEDVPAPHAALH